MVKKLLSVLMSVVLVTGLCPLPAYADLAAGAVGTAAEETASTIPLECTPLPGSNISAQDYRTRSAPVTSYLVPQGDGYLRVQGGIANTAAVAVYYDRDFNATQRREIPQELPLFGAFHETATNYYLVTGQNNASEDGTTEVYRVTKYDKDWNRLGSCGLYGANTVAPFNAGSCRIDDAGAYLAIHTCHTMYKSDDGLNHQANVTMLVNTDTMTIVKSRTGVSNNYTGYVSHSFNQFVKVHDGKLVTVDHGDSYPRSICLMQYNADITTGDYGWPATQATVLAIKGAAGINTTNASLGGLEIGTGAYLVAGNSIDQTSEQSLSTRNVFVASVSQSSAEVTFTWLTDYAEGEASPSTPHLVKAADDRFCVLWERDGSVLYRFVNAAGQPEADTYSTPGTLSDCAPIVENGTITWYTCQNGTEKLYRIPLDDPNGVQLVEKAYGHVFTWQKTEDGIATLKCDRCGEETTGMAPTSVTTYWLKAGEAQRSRTVPTGLQPGETVTYNTYFSYSGSTAGAATFPGITVEAADPVHTIVNATTSSAGTITLATPGYHTVRIYPTYNPDAVQTYTLFAEGDLAPVELAAGEQVSVSGSLVFGQRLSELSLNTARFVAAGTTTEVPGVLAFANPNTTLTVGTHDVDYTFTPTEPGYDRFTGTVPVTVEKATPTITAAPTADPATYHPARTLAHSLLWNGGASVRGTWQWKNPDQVPTVPGGTYPCVFTPSDTANYTTAETNVVLAVAKATPHLVNVSAAALAPGQPLSASAITGTAVYSAEDGTPVAGTFAWETPDLVPASGAACNVVFTPVDTQNFEAATVSVTPGAEAADDPAPVPEPNPPAADIANGTSGTCTWIIDGNGTLTIRPTDGISGTLSAGSYYAPWNGNAADVKALVIVAGVKAPANSSRLFASLSSLVTADVAKLDTSEATNIDNLFSGCSSLTALDLSQLDLSKATNAGSLFSGCASLTSLALPASGFAPTSVTSMFSGCSSLPALDLTMLDLTNATSLYSLLYGCSALADLKLPAAGAPAATTTSRMFYGCSSLANLDLSGFALPKVAIASSMFYRCSALADLKLPAFGTATLTNMESMFDSCSSLVAIDFGAIDTSAVTVMGSLFRNCSSLTAVDLSKVDTSAVTDMSGMFWGCLKLAALDLSPLDTSNVTSMASMFSACSSLTALDLSPLDTSNVTSMASMFSGCSSLASLAFGGKVNTSNVTSLASMFYNCTALASLDLTSFDTSKVTAANIMFYNCTGLRSLDLSSFDLTACQNVNSMFSGCSSLSEVKLGPAFSFKAGTSTASLPNPPSNALYKGTWARGNALAETTYTSAELVTAFTEDAAAAAGTYVWARMYADDAVVQSGTCGSTDDGADGTNVTYTFYGDGSLVLSGTGETGFYNTTPTFIGFVTPVAPWYDYRNSITSITVGEGITNINSALFAGTSITSIQLPSTIVDVAQTAFANCSQLRSITLNDGLETIGPDAFSMTALESLRIPKTVRYVDPTVFRSGGMTTSGYVRGIDLMKATVDPENPYLTIEDGVLFNADKTTLYVGSSSLTGTYTVPATVKVIDGAAFEGSNITGLVIPEGVEEIGAGAFNINKLDSVVIPDSVTKIGRSAFSNSTATSAKIGAGLADLGLNSILAFSKNLREVEFSEGLETVSDRSFGGCTALERAILPDSVKVIEGDAFNQCTALSEVHLGPNVESIGRTAFANCPALTSITLPDSLTTIAEEAFANTGITKISIPASVTSIGKDAFPESCDVELPPTLVRLDDGTYAPTADVTCLTYDFTYGQTEARGMLAQMNEFRAGDEAWYWNSSNTEQVQATGLSPLVYDYALERTAMKRAAEIAALFSHTRPDGSSCFTAFEGSYSTWGENIAMGQRTAEEAMEAWKETNYLYSGQGHRRNMLSGGFNAVGIGHAVCNGVHFWVQDFGYASAPDTNETPANDAASSNTMQFVGDRVVSHGDVVVNPASYAFTAVGDHAALPKASVTSVRFKAGSQTGSLASARVDLSWESADAAVASVENGEVTARVSKGSTELVAHAFGEELSVPVLIGVIDLSSATIAAIPDQAYTGAAVMPTVSVTLNGVELRENSDYTVMYADNVEPGEASVIVKGTGSYGGTARVTFKITAGTTPDPTPGTDPTPTPTPGTDPTPTPGTDPTPTPGTDPTTPGINPDPTPGTNPTPGTDPATPGTQPGEGDDDSVDRTPGTGTPSASDPSDPYDDPWDDFYDDFDDDDDLVDAPVKKGIAVNKTAVVNGATYKATSSSTVVFKKAPANKAKVTVPQKVKIKGVTYRVTGIAANAFKKSTAKTVTVKAKGLTKTSVKNCFKGAKKLKTVKLPAALKKAYRPLFKKSVCGKAITVK